MQPQNSANTCPKCGAPFLKSWEELNADQRFIVARLPASAEYSLDDRKNHRYCTRCWHEETAPEESIA